MSGRGAASQVDRRTGPGTELVPGPLRAVELSAGHWEIYRDGVRVGGISDVPGGGQLFGRLDVGLVVEGPTVLAVLRRLARRSRFVGLSRSVSAGGTA